MSSSSSSAIAVYTTLAEQLVGQTIEQGNILILQTLSAGAFGALFIAQQLLPNPQHVAIKCIIKPCAATNPRDHLFVCRELALQHASQGHPNVLRLHRYFEEGSCVFLVLDYFPDGDLFGMIAEQQAYVGRDDAIRDAAVQLVDGLQHLHSRGIFHRDIKPENVLCHAEDGRINLVLADFGLATHDEINQEWGVGSTYYMSPECHGSPDQTGRRRFAYSSRANDVWALGILIINLACSRNPWKVADISDSTYAGFLREPGFLLSILPISRELDDLLQDVLVPDFRQRITLPQLRERLLRINSFMLTAAELRDAPEAVRDAAKPLLAFYEMQEMIMLHPSIAGYHGTEAVDETVGNTVNSSVVGSNNLCLAGQASWVDVSVGDEDDTTGFTPSSYPYNICISSTSPPQHYQTTSVSPLPELHDQNHEDLFDDDDDDEEDEDEDSVYHMFHRPSHSRNLSTPSSVFSTCSSTFPPTPPNLSPCSGTPTALSPETYVSFIEQDTARIETCKQNLRHRAEGQSAANLLTTAQSALLWHLPPGPELCLAPSPAPAEYPPSAAPLNIAGAGETRQHKSGSLQTRIKGILGFHRPNWLSSSSPSFSSTRTSALRTQIIVPEYTSGPLVS